MCGEAAKCKCKKALELAEQVRRFEIELYWKRSAYFWTFIALAFAGYGALQMDGGVKPKRENLDFLLANVGFVASVAWFAVNRGSKYWQEYWETQVDRLEDGATGPLYGVVIARVSVDEKEEPWLERLKAWWRRPRSLKQWMTGAPRLQESEKDHVKRLSVPSVSKINQLGSLYVAIVWIILGARAHLGPKFCVDIRGWSVSFPEVFFVLTVVSLGVFCCLGKTKLGDYYYAEDCRKAINLGPCRHASADCCQNLAIR